ncbi:zinc finger protein sens-like [Copidosoma floridanum]|uniref:zinc finger protein sens-like n=1 Tax=Copidosoma floridanum TaxID=29053 RepID=UPI0006C990BA|nr:zinc finger protein sens-like [Copidosoma floridanum]
MISLLRRNRKKSKNSNNNRRALSRSVPSDHDTSESDNQQQQRPENFSSELLNSENSLDSLVFAASLGLVSRNNQVSPKDLMMIVQDQLQPKEQDQQSPTTTHINNNNNNNNNKKLVKHNHLKQQTEFYCKFCGKGYRWKSTMRRHESLECGNKPPSFQCPYCEYKARQRGNLTVHLKRHHYKHETSDD